MRPFLLLSTRPEDVAAEDGYAGFLLGGSRFNAGDPVEATFESAGCALRGNRMLTVDVEAA